MSMSKHTAISAKTKRIVWERDNMRCVVCGQVCDVTNACSHIVRRSQGGRGIPENIVTHCSECHRLYDSYDEATRQATMDYILAKYPHWNKEKVTFRRYEKDGSKGQY